MLPPSSSHSSNLHDPVSSIPIPKMDLLPQGHPNGHHHQQQNWYRKDAHHRHPPSSNPSNILPVPISSRRKLPKKPLPIHGGRNRHRYVLPLKSLFFSRTNIPHAHPYPQNQKSKKKNPFLIKRNPLLRFIHSNPSANQNLRSGLW